MGCDAMGVATTANDHGSLEPVELALVDHVERGEVLDLARNMPVDEEAMRSWDAPRTVRAQVVRDIARGRLATNPDPHGLRLRGARISGRLDLENIISTVALEFDHCLFEHGLVARDATLPGLALGGCVIEHPIEPPLNAARLTARVLNIEHATISGHTDRGAVRLVGAHLGELSCTGATLRNDIGPALDAESLHVDQDVSITGGFEAVGAGELGAVRLLGAHLGLLDCTGASLRNNTGSALHANSMRVDQSMFCTGGFEAVGAGELGAVRLLGAHLGLLDCTGASLRNNTGPALHADRLRVEQSMFLRSGFEAVGAGELGAVRLLGAHLGLLDCTGASLRNNTGPALHADGLSVDQDVFLTGGFKAVGAGELGAVRLLGAHLGELSCKDSSLRNNTGPALAADRLRVEQSMFLRGEFEAVGAGEAGAVLLLNAHLGQLDCTGASLRNNTGPALHADRLRVEQSMFLRSGFEAVGAGELGAVRLLGAHLGLLDCTGASLRNNSGPALDAEGLRSDQRVVLGGAFAAVGAGASVVVDLTGVQAGVLAFDPARLEHRSDPHARLTVDGLVYSGLPLGVGPNGWLSLIRDGTPGYAAQPYQLLAAAHRAAGHDGQARRVLRLQRYDQIHRTALTGRAERLWARFTGLTLGYGYQPWRALIGLLAVVATAVLLAILLGGQGGLTQVQTPPPPSPLGCTVVERVGVGLDLGTPLLTTGARIRCEATTTLSGQILTGTGWALRVLAWAFATLFIAGFTGAVRKT